MNGLREGTLDFNKISMAEWLQVSFLTLFNNDEMHIDQKITYGGSVYTLHACVASVNPAVGDVSTIRKEQ